MLRVDEKIEWIWSNFLVLHACWNISYMKQCAQSIVPWQVWENTSVNRNCEKYCTPAFLMVNNNSGTVNWNNGHNVHIKSFYLFLWKYNVPSGQFINNLNHISLNKVLRIDTFKLARVIAFSMEFANNGFINICAALIFMVRTTNEIANQWIGKFSRT